MRTSEFSNDSKYRILSPPRLSESTPSIATKHKNLACWHQFSNATKIIEYWQFRKFNCFFFAVSVGIGTAGASKWGFKDVYCDIKPC